MKKLSNLLSKIKNGCIGNAKIIELRYKKEWLKPLYILYKEGYLQNYIVRDGKLYIYLRYFKGKNCIRIIKNFAKPSHFIYIKRKHLWLFNRYSGTLVLSTIKGLKTHEECLVENLGGKILFFVG